MNAFTNALRQENATVAVFLSLALLVLRSECVAKSAKKILLVEDNSDIRELLALLMKRLGYEVFEAGTGLEAIDLASRVQPDLIMMDLRLPAMNGVETTERLKANTPTKDIPVLVITASGAGIVTQSALAAGAAEILHKPIDVTTLSNVLHRHLSARTNKEMLDTKELSEQRSQSGSPKLVDQSTKERQS
jgi:CheY-like chemotaxis protein